MKQKPSLEPARRAYSYIRFSRATQADGDSNRRQSKATADYCQRLGFLLDDTLKLRDEGVSAFKGRNAAKGALGRFLDAVEAKTIPRGSALIVESLDRLSRQTPRKTIRLLDEILEAGIEIHLTMVNKVFRPDAPASEEGMDLMMATLWAIRSNEESETKSQRLREAFAEKREEAKNGSAIVSKSLPWWLIWQDGKIVCPPEQKAVLVSMFELTAEGYSSIRVARKLNAEGAPTWRKKQKKWNAARVRDAIRSDAPLGILRPTAKTVAAIQEEAGRPKKDGDVPRLLEDYILEGYYPQVVTPELATRARATLQKNARHDRGRESRHAIHLFRGILKAAPVGQWMRCQSHRNGKPDQNGVKTWNTYYDAVDEGTGRMVMSVSAKQLETVLLTGLSEITVDDIIPRTVGKVPASVKLRAKIRDLEAKISNVGAAVEAGSVSLAKRLIELEKEAGRSREELKKAEAEEALPPSAPTALAHIQATPIDCLNSPAHRETIAAHFRRLIDRIDIAHSVVEVAGATPDKPLIEMMRNSEAEAEPIWQDIGKGERFNVLPDPTQKRYRRPLAILVHFCGGAKRLILRRPSDVANFPDGILSLRVDS